MKVPSANFRSGIALVIVMICIAVLSIMAAAFAFSMKVETKLAQNANSETELTWQGLSGVEFANWVLAQQMTIPQERDYDSLNQKWAGGPGSMMTSNNPLADISLDNYPLGNGHFSVKITDLERKLNINMADQQLLQRAFDVIGVDAGESSPIVASILDWIDSGDGDSTHIGGAESDYYESLDPPYSAKNRPIDDLSELMLIRGITPDMFWGGVATNHPPAKFQMKLGMHRGSSFGPLTYSVGLSEAFTPISSGQLNINTASAATMQMIPFLDENIAMEIVRLRSGPDGVDGTEDDIPLRSPNELRNTGINPQVFQQIARYFTTRSSTFEITVDADVSGYRRKFGSIVRRNSPKDVKVLTFSWK